MDFSLTEEQKALKMMVADFAKKELAPIALEYDKRSEFPMEVFKTYADMGLHCPDIPEEYGGPGLDTVSTVIVTEELAKGCAGFASAMAALGLAIHPVEMAGTEEQKQKYFKTIVDGNLAGFCLTEPEAGCDTGSVQTRAVRDGDEYVINGIKRFITNGSLGKEFSVFAMTDPSKGIKGLTGFIVEAGTPGLSAGKHEDKLGIRCSDTSEVIFDNVRIPVSNRLGEEGQGFSIAMETLDVGRVVCAAMSLGIAQCALEHCLEYSQQRVQFGRPIVKNQAIQFMLADMATEIEAARQLTLYAAYLRDQRDPSFVKAASMAKTYASEMAMKLTVDAVQIYGGCGYIKDYPMEKLMRDAKIMSIIEGTNQIQRKVIAGQLLAGK